MQRFWVIQLCYWYGETVICQFWDETFTIWWNNFKNSGLLFCIVNCFKENIHFLICSWCHTSRSLYRSMVVSCLNCMSCRTFKVNVAYVCWWNLHKLLHLRHSCLSWNSLSLLQEANNMPERYMHLTLIASNFQLPLQSWLKLQLCESMPPRA